MLAGQSQRQPEVSAAAIVQDCRLRDNGFHIGLEHGLTAGPRRSRVFQAARLIMLSEMVAGKIDGTKTLCYPSVDAITLANLRVTMTKFIVDMSLFRYLRLYCHANNFDLDGFRKQLRYEGWDKKNPTFKQDFEKIIRERLISLDDFLDATDIEIDSERELDEFLQGIFDYLYYDGPYP